MSDSDAESPEAFASLTRNALLKGFAIPVGILLFFALAPAWLNHNLHSSIADNIAHSSELSVTDKAERLAAYNRVDFAEVCSGPAPAGLERLRARMEEAGVCGQFLRLRWGLGLSAALVAILAGVTVATFVLTRRARASRTDLIAAYHLGWRLSIGAAMTKVLLLTPLLAYGTFELTTLAFERYLPKLILLIVIGGLVALWKSASILLKPVPMEFDVPMARAVTPAEAPRLWADVQAAAARLGTAAPDAIIVGMENNFYVTELAMKLPAGRAEGRSLYLSRPLMQQLAPAEVLAIIGHELGHFRGDDTRITREFYPLRHRANATLAAMAESGWVGWTSVHALLFFHWSFGSVESALSRERELAADRAAAELTSAPAAASALIKIHVFTEAFMRAIGKGAANPFTVPLAGFVRTELVANDGFWHQLLEQKAAHPLDSHPSLRVRLEALGQPVDLERAKATATTEVESAHALWFAGADALFAGIEAEALQAIGRVRAATADYATPEGKQLLDQHFPEIRWRTRATGLWLKIGCCGLGLGISLLLLAVIDGWALKLMMAGFAAVCGWPIVMLWRRHHGGEFVLRPDSLSYTGWLRPLRFADVADLTARSEYGAITVTFVLKAKAPGIWKHSPVGWIQSKAVSLDLGLIPGKHQETLQTLARYVSHQV